jgi:hypothetical protein
VLSFDGVAREVCVARRIRTNTPLQALVMLNDSVYVEAARRLALSIAGQDAVQDARRQIALLYEKALGRPPDAARLEPLYQLYLKALQRYRNNPAARSEMTGCDPAHDLPEQAALAMVAGAVFNLDEFLTKN